MRHLIGIALPYITYVYHIYIYIYTHLNYTCQTCQYSYDIDMGQWCMYIYIYIHTYDFFLYTCGWCWIGKSFLMSLYIPSLRTMHEYWNVFFTRLLYTWRLVFVWQNWFSFVSTFRTPLEFPHHEEIRFEFIIDDLLYPNIDTMTIGMNLFVVVRR